jgi:foldase protein PrsA
MRNSKLAFLAVVFAVVALSSGCGRRTMVSVNGDKITKAEFQRRLERLPVPSGTGAPPQQAGALVMNQLVNEKLILGLAKEKKVEPTEAQVNKKVELMKKEGNLQQMLNQRGIGDIEDFKHELSVNQAFTNVMTKGVDIKDADVKAQYDQLLNAKQSPFKRAEQVEIAIILASTKDKIDKASSLLKSGTEFASVAMKLSEDQFTAKQGGVAGWLQKNDPRIPKVVSEVAFKTRVNTVSEPFQADYVGGKKWFIVKVRQHKDAKTQSYNEVKDLLREQMALQKSAQTTNFNKVLSDYREKSKIVVKVQRYKQIIKGPDSEKKDKKKD